MELLKSQRALAGQITFDLIMGGLQIGTPEGLLGYDVKRLKRLWNEVELTTGQKFSAIFPRFCLPQRNQLPGLWRLPAYTMTAIRPLSFFINCKQHFILRLRISTTRRCWPNYLVYPNRSLKTRFIQPPSLIRPVNILTMPNLCRQTRCHTFLIDTGSGYQLLCGGYVTEEFLVRDILFRLNQAPY